MNHERTPCNMGVTVLAEIFTSGAKWAKKYRSELFLKNFSKISEILGKNRPKWQKSDFFDLDFSGTKNGRGNKFQEHLWWENVWIFIIFWNFEEILRRGHDTEIFHFSVFSGFHFSVRELPPNFFSGANRTKCTQNIKNPPYGKSLKLRNWPFCPKRDFSVFLIFSENLSKFSKNFDSIKFLGQFPTFYLFWPSLYLKNKNPKIAFKVGHPTLAAPFWTFLPIFPRFFPSARKPSRGSPKFQLPSNSLDNFAHFYQYRPCLYIEI